MKSINNKFTKGIGNILSPTLINLFIVFALAIIIILIYIKYKKIELFNNKNGNNNNNLIENFNNNSNMVIMGVNSGGYIYYDNNPTSPSWTLLSGLLTNLSYSNGQVYGVNAAGNIFYNADYTTSNWVRVPGGLKQVSFDGYNMIVMAIGLNDEIYYANQNITTAPNWTQVGGRLRNLSYSNGQVYGVNSDGNIYYNADYTSSNWVQVPGGLKQVTFDGYHMIVMGVNSADMIYYADINIGTTPNWTLLSGRLTNVAYYDGKAFGVNGAGMIYYNNNYITSNWYQLYGLLSQVSVGRAPARPTKLSDPLIGVTSINIKNDNATNFFRNGANWGKYLQISQLAVYTMVNGVETNIATKGTATASSSPPNNPPSAAIDGVLRARNYAKEKGSFHSGGNAPEWWKLVLDKAYNIHKIVYYNRADCCPIRAKGCELTVFNDNSTTTPILKTILTEDLVQTIEAPIVALQPPPPPPPPPPPQPTLPLPQPTQESEPEPEPEPTPMPTPIPTTIPTIPDGYIQSLLDNYTFNAKNKIYYQNLLNIQQETIQKLGDKVNDTLNSF